MPHWREYQCQRCSGSFMTKDVELLGRILCRECAAKLDDETPDRSWIEFEAIHRWRRRRTDGC